jgi:hypothetical protein
MRKIGMALIVVLSCTTTAFAGSNGTVTDVTANLMWQQCSAGLSGSSCTTGTVETYDWTGAIAYCEGLSLGGFSDWRLPKIKELQSIVDMTRATAPAVYMLYFPSTLSSKYWSSTTYAPMTSVAWAVDFGYGNTYGDGKGNTYYVRCVRGQ